MKKINLLAIMGVALFLVIVAGIFVFVCKDDKPTEECIILGASNRTEVKKYIESNGIEKYSFDTNTCYLGEIEVLGKEAQVEFYFDEKEETKQIVTYYTLFQYVNEKATENEIESVEDNKLYSFTDKDKKKIEESFDEIKEVFGAYMGCELEQYDLLPTHEGVSLEDDAKSFYQGDVIREYSVRDKMGVLWLLRYEASYGNATATLVKIVDDTEYEGFIPVIDMSTK